jgi:RNA methyltransferase, TrmH family
LNTEDLKYYTKLKQKKYREENKQFLIEGIHLIEECFRSKYYKKNLTKVFIRNDFSEERILRRLKDIDTEYLKTLEFNKLSETENSQGIIGLLQKPENLPQPENKIICALDNINDPGNLGTILRACWWFGIENILISKNSAEIYNSKVIRASQGAIFNLHINDNKNLPEILDNYFKNGYEIVLTDLSANKTISKYEFHKDRKYIVVFGNEANGISKEIKSVSNYSKIKIESYTNCESLNVASSAAIILYVIKKSTD